MTARWPAHHVLAVAVAALVVGPRWAALVPLLAGLAWLTQPRRGWAAVAVVVAVVAAVGGAWRRTSVLHAAAAPLERGVTVRPGEPLEVLEPARRSMNGGWRTTARLRGATVELRTPAAVRRPPGLLPGRIIGATGRLRPVSEQARAAPARGIALVLYADRTTPARGRRGGWRGALDRVRERAERTLSSGLDPPRTALFRGMVLGQDDGFDDAQTVAYRRSGLSHLVAASGQNVALLAALVLLVGAALGVPRRPRIALAVLAVCAYVPLAGSGPSIRRAGVMGVLTLLALALGRPSDRWWALLAAALVTVLVDPFSPQQLGWQLSFAAVLGLMVLADPLTAAVARRGAPRWVGAALSVPIAAGLATAPVLAATVEKVSVTSLPANVLAEPVVAPITWLGMVAGLIGPAVGGLSGVLVGAAGPFLGWVEGTARWMSAPGWAVLTPGPALAALPAVLALVAILIVARPPGLVRATDRVRRALADTALGRGWRVARRTRRRRRTGAAAVILVALLLAGIGVRIGVERESGTTLGPPGVVVLDVGQGSATLLRDRGATILVDAGPAAGRVVDRLRDQGVKRLDVLVLSHAAADHTGGAPAVAAAMRPGLVLDGTDGNPDPPAAVADALVRRSGGRVVAPRAGMALRVGGIVLAVRWPPPRAGPRIPGEDANDRATVVRATVGGLRVLVPSDREGIPLRRAAGGPVDVLVMPHHGSSDDDVPRLLDVLHPAVAVAQVGAHNRYGHPAPPTVAALRAAHVPLERTDRDGSVVLTAVPGRDGRTAGVRVR